MSRLKQQRLRLEISQYELEKASGIRQSKISLIEAGFRIPSVDEKSKLAKALNVNEDWLFPEDNKEDSDGLRYEVKATEIREK